MHSPFEESRALSEVYIVDGVRTPVGRYGGALSSVRPDDLAALTVREVVARTGIDPGVVEEVILGNANGAGEENRNVARMAALLAGLPEEVPGYTVNRLCASGLSAVGNAANMIRSREIDVAVAGGVESMSRAPWVLAKPTKAFASPSEMFDTSIGWRFVNPVFMEREGITASMPETAESLARLDGISREDSDAFALRSHLRAVAAIDAGRFEREIVPVPVKSARSGEAHVEVDEGPRRESSLEALARLRPVVRGGSVVTAGNASSLNDGASALLLASGTAVQRHGLKPRARIVATASAGVAPGIMGIGPVPATEKLLARTGVRLNDIDAIELNEAFAPQALAVIRRLGIDSARADRIVNADGGAIALGHPLGSSGARIVVTLLGRLEREQAKLGLATLCVGVGQGVSMLIERV